MQQGGFGLNWDAGMAGKVVLGVLETGDTVGVPD
jgi:hypothetical protein